MAVPDESPALHRLAGSGGAARGHDVRGQRDRLAREFGTNASRGLRHPAEVASSVPWVHTRNPRGVGLPLGGFEMGFAAGDVNLFRYVKNSPTNATDPSGLEEIMGRWGIPVAPPASMGPKKFNATDLYLREDSTKWLKGKAQSGSEMQYRYYTYYGFRVYEIVVPRKEGPAHSWVELIPYRAGSGAPPSDMCAEWKTFGYLKNQDWHGYAKQRQGQQVLLGASRPYSLYVSGSY